MGALASLIRASNAGECVSALGYLTGENLSRDWPLECATSLFPVGILCLCEIVFRSV
jgi:hypothetical protein